MASRKTSTHAKVHTSRQKSPAGDKMKIASTATSDSTATTTARLNSTALSSPENSVTVSLLADGIGPSSAPSNKMKKSYFNWSSIKAQELLIELVIEHKPFAATKNKTNAWQFIANNRVHQCRELKLATANTELTARATKTKAETMLKEYREKREEIKRAMGIAITCV